MIALGINPLTWTNDDFPELGDDVPLLTCLSQARAAGFSGVELGRKFPRNASELAPLLNAHGLKLVSGWASGQLLELSAEEQRAQLAPHLELLLALGAKVLIFAETSFAIHGQDRPLSARPALDEARFDALCERIDELGAMVLQDGLRLAYHHHMGTVIQTQSEIERLMQRTSRDVSLLLDTGHLAYAGGDAEAVIERYGGRIAHVHLKDLRTLVLRSLGETTFKEAVLNGIFTVPGDGDLDFEGVLRGLKAAGYSGWLVVEAEQDPVRAPPEIYAKKGFEHVAGLARKLGYTRRDP